MGNVDGVPVVSQTKSLVQTIAGDTDGARQTQENFSRQCPVVSQARSLVEVSMGDPKAALETQKQFLVNAPNLLMFGAGWPVGLALAVSMGGLSPQATRATVHNVVEHVYEETDERKKTEKIEKLEDQLAELKEEVDNVNPIFTKYTGVKATFSEEKDVMITKHSALSDTTVIKKTIRDMLASFPLVDVLVENVAMVVLAALEHAKESSVIIRWHAHHFVERVGDKVYGMEAHFKVKMLEEDKGRIRSNKEVVVLIAYKCLAHTM